VFEEPIRGWDGEEVLIRYDADSGAWMFVAVHSTLLGPAAGGTRLRSYGSPEEGLRDALLLSGAMTLKMATAGLPFGGGKAVLAVSEVPPPGDQARNSLLRRYARLVDALGGTYVTAADMNTGEADMDVIGEVTPHVFGKSVGGSGSPAPGTAIGVFHGIVAACAHVFGSPSLEGRTVLIQGCGAVGDRLADHLRDAGASLLLADVDASRAAATAARTAGQVVQRDEVLGAPCDVFAPCATGGVLSAESIPKLACRIVAGAANNQLATPQDAERLREAGILYAPDFVINAGGVLWLIGYERLGWDDAAMAARLAGIGATLETVFTSAEREGVTPAAAADRLARERIAAAG
jgi:leucine dehydrogenase